MLGVSKSTLRRMEGEQTVSEQKEALQDPRYTCGATIMVTVRLGTFNVEPGPLARSSPLPSSIPI